MKLLQSEGPEEGSLAVTFRCPQCGFRVAMLTNQFETQLIRSLGVTMGSRSEPDRPFEHLRASMAHAAPMQTVDPMQAGEQTRTEQAASEGPGCPFAAMVSTQIEATSPVHWTAEAEARIERIPPFVREMAKRAVERFARGRGFTTITEPVLEQARDALGM
jgi:Proto-chlorophyllide reductase 57 kD subunit